jgi:hypothetical protein
VPRLAVLGHNGAVQFRFIGHGTLVSWKNPVSS